MKLLMFTPLPPTPTGIADYSEALRSALEKRDGGLAIECIRNEEEASRFEPPPEPHLRMYHVGNSVHHDFLYPALFRYPGILVLHDLVLHHSRLFSHLESPEVRAYREDMGDLEKRARARKRLEEYREEARAAYPEVGDVLSEIALRIGGGRLLYAYPLYEHLVRRSDITLVHGTAAREQVLASCPGSRVERIRMGIALPDPVSREEARARLGLSPTGWILASFGLVTPEKRISTAIRALARLRDSGVEAEYFLVGGTVPHYDPLTEARELGVAERVRVLGRVSEEELSLYAFASDVCLNLRYPSAGETSATLLRLLACGRPVMVTDQLHVKDFPEIVVARSSLLGDEDGLYCDLLDLLRSERRRRSLGEAARRFAATEASLEGMAEDYLAVIRSLAPAGL